MPSTTDKKISPSKLMGKDGGELGKVGGGLFGGLGKTGKLAQVVRGNKKAIAINARKITLLKNITKEQQKQDAGDTIGDKLPGGGGGLKSILGSIASTMDGILETLQLQNKLDVKAANDARKKNEKDKRSLGESALEATKNALVSAGEKMLAPVKSIFGKIFDFIKIIFLGRIAIKLWEWFADPKNTEKVKSLFRFIKDWWPVIVAGIMAVIGPGVTFTVGAIALLGWATVKIVDAVKSVFGFGKKIDKELKTGTKQSEKDMLGTKAGIDKRMEAQVNDAQKDKPNVDPVQTPDSDAQKIPAKEMAQGGQVPGKGDKDTVPAMLTPGEFVMSKGAVNRFGAGTLAGMNAAGGGSNSATMNGEGVMGFRGGGEVKGPGGIDEVSAKLTAGEFVMSKGAVQKYGADTLEGMNAAAGGTNMPTMGRYSGGGKAGSFDKSHYGTEGYQIGQVQPPTLVVGQEKFEEKVVSKDGEIVDDKSYEKFTEMIASIGVPDLIEHQKQLVGEIRKVPGYENINIMEVINRDVNMPLDQYLPILMNSDAQKATFAKWDAAHQADLDLRGIDPSKGYSMGYNGGGLVPGAVVGGTNKPDMVKVPHFSGGGPVSNISPPIRPSSTVAYAHQHAQEGEQPFVPTGAATLPDFDASTMNSSAKIKVLGITV